MDEFAFVLGILFLTVVVPVWIRNHYRHAQEARRALNDQDARELETLRGVADRLEGRIRTLERVLDAEAPGWRNKV